jgi:hypothetical protein
MSGKLLALILPECQQFQLRSPVGDHGADAGTGGADQPFSGSRRFAGRARLLADFRMCC